MLSHRTASATAVRETATLAALARGDVNGLVGVGYDRSALRTNPLGPGVKIMF